MPASRFLTYSLLSALLTACGGGNSASNTTAVEQSAAPVLSAMAMVEPVAACSQI